MKFDPNKTYKTRSGFPYRNYCTDAGGDYPIHGAFLSNGKWWPVSHTADLEYGRNAVNNHPSDLIEHNPAEELVVDQPVMVRLHPSSEWERRYFAKYENGKVYTWTNGTTSWTAEASMAWNYWYLPTPEELSNGKV
jgi:hypothetical protein